MNEGDGIDLRRRMPFIVLGAALVIGLIIGAVVWFVQSRPDPARTETGNNAPETSLTPRTGTPAPVQAGVLGQPTEIVGLYGTGSVVVNRATWHTTGDIVPAAGRQYLTVEFEVTAQGGAIALQKEMFTAYEANKTEHVPTIGAGENNDLGNIEAVPGTPAQFTVSFDLPPGATTVILTDEGFNPLVVYEVPGP